MKGQKRSEEAMSLRVFKSSTAFTAVFAAAMGSHAYAAELPGDVNDYAKMSLDASLGEFSIEVKQDALDKVRSVSIDGPCSAIGGEITKISILVDKAPASIKFYDQAGCDIKKESAKELNAKAEKKQGEAEKTAPLGDFLVYEMNKATGAFDGLRMNSVARSVRVVWKTKAGGLRDECHDISAVFTPRIEFGKDFASLVAVAAFSDAKCTAKLAQEILDQEAAAAADAEREKNGGAALIDKPGTGTSGASGAGTSGASGAGTSGASGAGSGAAKFQNNLDDSAVRDISSYQAMNIDGVGGPDLYIGVNKKGQPEILMDTDGDGIPDTAVPLSITKAKDKGKQPDATAAQTEAQKKAEDQAEKASETVDVLQDSEGDLLIKEDSQLNPSKPKVGSVRIGGQCFPMQDGQLVLDNSQKLTLNTVVEMFSDADCQKKISETTLGALLDQESRQNLERLLSLREEKDGTLSLGSRPEDLFDPAARSVAAIKIGDKCTPLEGGRLNLGKREALDESMKVGLYEDTSCTKKLQDVTLGELLKMYDKVVEDGTQEGKNVDIKYDGDALRITRANTDVDSVALVGKDGKEVCYELTGMTNLVIPGAELFDVASAKVFDEPGCKGKLLEEIPLGDMNIKATAKTQASDGKKAVVANDASGENIALRRKDQAVKSAKLIGPDKNSPDVCVNFLAQGDTLLVPKATLKKAIERVEFFDKPNCDGNKIDESDVRDLGISPSAVGDKVPNSVSGAGGRPIETADAAISYSAKDDTFNVTRKDDKVKSVGLLDANGKPVAGSCVNFTSDKAAIVGASKLTDEKIGKVVMFDAADCQGKQVNAVDVSGSGVNAAKEALEGVQAKPSDNALASAQFDAKTGDLTVTRKNDSAKSAALVDANGKVIEDSCVNFGADNKAVFKDAAQASEGRLSGVRMFDQADCKGKDLGTLDVADTGVNAGKPGAAEQPTQGTGTPAVSAEAQVGYDAKNDKLTVERKTDDAKSFGLLDERGLPVPDSCVNFENGNKAELNGAAKLTKAKISRLMLFANADCQGTPIGSVDVTQTGVNASKEKPSDNLTPAQGDKAVAAYSPDTDTLTVGRKSDDVKSFGALDETGAPIPGSCVNFTESDKADLKGASKLTGKKIAKLALFGAADCQGAPVGELDVSKTGVNASKEKGAGTGAGAGDNNGQQGTNAGKPVKADGADVSYSPKDDRLDVTRTNDAAKSFGILDDKDAPIPGSCVNFGADGKASLAGASKLSKNKLSRIVLFDAADCEGKPISDSDITGTGVNAGKEGGVQGSGSDTGGAAENADAAVKYSAADDKLTVDRKKDNVKSFGLLDEKGAPVPGSCVNFAGKNTAELAGVSKLSPNKLERAVFFDSDDCKGTPLSNVDISKTGVNAAKEGAGQQPGAGGKDDGKQPGVGGKGDDDQSSGQPAENKDASASYSPKDDTLTLNRKNDKVKSFGLLDDKGAPIPGTCVNFDAKGKAALKGASAVSGPGKVGKAVLFDQQDCQGAAIGELDVSGTGVNAGKSGGGAKADSEIKTKDADIAYSAKDDALTIGRKNPAVKSAGIVDGDGNLVEGSCVDFTAGDRATIKNASALSDKPAATVAMFDQAGCKGKTVGQADIRGTGINDKAAGAGTPGKAETKVESADANVTYNPNNDTLKVDAKNDKVKSAAAVGKDGKVIPESCIDVGKGDVIENASKLAKGGIGAVRLFDGADCKGNKVSDVDLSKADLSPVADGKCPAKVTAGVNELLDISFDGDTLVAIRKDSKLVTTLNYNGKNFDFAGKATLRIPGAPTTRGLEIVDCNGAKIAADANAPKQSEGATAGLSYNPRTDALQVDRKDDKVKSAAAVNEKGEVIPNSCVNFAEGEDKSHIESVSKLAAKPAGVRTFDQADCKGAKLEDVKSPEGNLTPVAEGACPAKLDVKNIGDYLDLSLKGDTLIAVSKDSKLVRGIRVGDQDFSFDGKIKLTVPGVSDVKTVELQDCNGAYHNSSGAGASASQSTAKTENANADVTVDKATDTAQIDRKNKDVQSAAVVDKDGKVVPESCVNFEDKDSAKIKDVSKAAPGGEGKVRLFDGKDCSGKTVDDVVLPKPGAAASATQETKVESENADVVYSPKNDTLQVDRKNKDVDSAAIVDKTGKVIPESCVNFDEKDSAVIENASKIAKEGVGSVRLFDEKDCAGKKVDDVDLSKANVTSAAESGECPAKVSAPLSDLIDISFEGDTMVAIRKDSKLVTSLRYNGKVFDFAGKATLRIPGAPDSRGLELIDCNGSSIAADANAPKQAEGKTADMNYNPRTDAIEVTAKDKNVKSAAAIDDKNQVIPDACVNFEKGDDKAHIENASALSAKPAGIRTFDKENCQGKPLEDVKTPAGTNIEPATEGACPEKLDVNNINDLLDLSFKGDALIAVSKDSKLVTGIRVGGQDYSFDGKVKLTVPGVSDARDVELKDCNGSYHKNGASGGPRKNVGEKADVEYKPKENALDVVRKDDKIKSAAVVDEKGNTVKDACANFENGDKASIDLAKVPGKVDSVKTFDQKDCKGSVVSEEKVKNLDVNPADEKGCPAEVKPENVDDLVTFSFDGNTMIVIRNDSKLVQAVSVGGKRYDFNGQVKLSIPGYSDARGAEIVDCNGSSHPVGNQGPRKVEDEKSGVVYRPNDGRLDVTPKDKTITSLAPVNDKGVTDKDRCVNLNGANTASVDVSKFDGTVGSVAMFDKEDCAGEPKSETNVEPLDVKQNTDKQDACQSEAFKGKPDELVKMDVTPDGLAATKLNSDIVKGLRVKGQDYDFTGKTKLVVPGVADTDDVEIIDCDNNVVATKDLNKDGSVRPTDVEPNPAEECPIPTPSANPMDFISFKFRPEGLQILRKDVCLYCIDLGELGKFSMASKKDIVLKNIKSPDDIRTMKLYSDEACTQLLSELKGSKPDDTKPGDTKPGDTKPGDTKPGDTKPGDTKPDDTKPGETKPGTIDVTPPKDGKECKDGTYLKDFKGKIDELVKLKLDGETLSAIRLNTDVVKALRINNKQYDFAGRSNLSLPGVNSVNDVEVIDCNGDVIANKDLNNDGSIPQVTDKPREDCPKPDAVAENMDSNKLVMQEYDKQSDSLKLVNLNSKLVDAVEIGGKKYGFNGKTSLIIPGLGGPKDVNVVDCNGDTIAKAPAKNDECVSEPVKGSPEDLISYQIKGKDLIVKKEDKRAGGISLAGKSHMFEAGQNSLTVKSINLDDLDSIQILGCDGKVLNEFVTGICSYNPGTDESPITFTGDTDYFNYIYENGQLKLFRVLADADSLKVDGVTECINVSNENKALAPITVALEDLSKIEIFDFPNCQTKIGEMVVSSVNKGAADKAAVDGLLKDKAKPGEPKKGEQGFEPGAMAAEQTGPANYAVVPESSAIEINVQINGQDHPGNVKVTGGFIKFADASKFETSEVELKGEVELDGALGALLGVAEVFTGALQMSFTSSSITPAGEGKYEVVGTVKLTGLGFITKEVSNIKGTVSDFKVEGSGQGSKVTVKTTINVEPGAFDTDVTGGKIEATVLADYKDASGAEGEDLVAGAGMASFSSRQESSTSGLSQSRVKSSGEVVTKKEDFKDTPDQINKEDVATQVANAVREHNATSDVKVCAPAGGKGIAETNTKPGDKKPGDKGKDNPGLSVCTEFDPIKKRDAKEAGKDGDAKSEAPDQGNLRDQAGNVDATDGAKAGISDNNKADRDAADASAECKPDEKGKLPDGCVAETGKNDGSKEAKGFDYSKYQQDKEPAKPVDTSKVRLGKLANKWSPVTVSITAPAEICSTVANLQANNLHVRFEMEDHSSEGAKAYKYVVPGFLRGGKAGSAPADCGTEWEARFTPPAEGEWTYRVYLEKDGKPVEGLDHTEGKVQIGAPRQEGFYRLGSLRINNKGEDADGKKAQGVTFLSFDSKVDGRPGDSFFGLGLMLKADGMDPEAVKTALSGLSLEGLNLVSFDMAQYVVGQGEEVKFDNVRLAALSDTLESLQQQGLKTGQPVAALISLGGIDKFDGEGRKLFIDHMVARFGSLNGLVWLAPEAATAEDIDYLKKADHVGLHPVVAKAGSPVEGSVDVALIPQEQLESFDEAKAHWLEVKAPSKDTAPIWSAAMKGYSGVTFNLADMTPDALMGNQAKLDELSAMVEASMRISDMLMHAPFADLAKKPEVQCEGKCMVFGGSHVAAYVKKGESVSLGALSDKVGEKAAVEWYDPATGEMLNGVTTELAGGAITMSGEAANYPELVAVITLSGAKAPNDKPGEVDSKPASNADDVTKEAKPDDMNSKPL